jgi:hypothetical protein
MYIIYELVADNRCGSSYEQELKMEVINGKGRHVLVAIVCCLDMPVGHFSEVRYF